MRRVAIPPSSAPRKITPQENMSSLAMNIRSHASSEWSGVSDQAICRRVCHSLMKCENDPSATAARSDNP